MNRDFLRGLGLEDEQVNAIMSRHGTTIAEKENDITALNKEIDDLKKEIKDNKNADVDEESSERIAELETEVERLENEVATQERNHHIERYVDSLGTRDAAYIMDKLSDIEFKDGELVGINERVEELKGKHPLLFEPEEPAEPEKPTKPRPWSQGNSTGSGGVMTKAEIMAVEDRKERQRLIQEHKDLF